MMDYRAIRKAAGLTQEEVGQALGLSDTTVCYFEKGRCNTIAVDTYNKLNDYYKCLAEQQLEEERGFGAAALRTVGQLNEQLGVISDKLNKLHNDMMPLKNKVDFLPTDIARLTRLYNKNVADIADLSKKLTPIYQDFSTLQNAVSSQNKAIQALLAAPKHDAEDKAKEQAAFALLKADVNKLKGAVSNLQWTLVVETIFIFALAVTTAWRLG